MYYVGGVVGGIAGGSFEKMCDLKQYLGYFLESYLYKSLKI